MSDIIDDGSFVVMSEKFLRMTQVKTIERYDSVTGETYTEMVPQQLDGEGFAEDEPIFTVYTPL